MRPTPILPPLLAPKKKRRRRGCSEPARASALLPPWCCSWRPRRRRLLLVEGIARSARYDSLANYEPPVMTRIHAHDGSLMAEYARERRIFVPINVPPKQVIAAFLSAEDRRFYDHGGSTSLASPRACVNNLQNYGNKRRRAPRPSPSRWRRTSCCPASRSSTAN